MPPQRPPSGGAAPRAAAPPLPPAHAAARLRLAARAAAGAAAALCAAAAAAAYAMRAFAPLQLAAAWLLLEVGFVFHYRGRLARFNRQPHEHRPANHDGARTAQRFYDLRHYFPFSEFYLRYWFRCVDMKAIGRGNVLDLFSYGFWYLTREQLAERGELPFLEGLLDKLQEESKIDLKEDTTPDLPMMSHLLEDLPAIYRPLAFYAFTEGLGLITSAMLWAAGFERHDLRGLVYYTTPGCPGAGAEQTPVVMMHGVGAGVLPYMDLVLSLAATGRALVVPEYRHVSMRLSATIPTIEQLATSAATFLMAMGYDKVHLMGHSYGSMVASRFVQLHPKAVTTLTLLDPVCFGMFMPTLLYTFLYSFPASGNIIIDAGMYFVSRELHMTATFCRQFYWSDYNLWPEYLPRHTLAVLGGKDRLCQAEEIRVWLVKETNARLMYDPEAVHAAMLMQPGYIGQILREWWIMVGEAEAEVEAEAEANGAAAGAVIAEIFAPTAAAAEPPLIKAIAAKEAAVAEAVAADGAARHDQQQQHQQHQHRPPQHPRERARRRPNPFFSTAHAHAAAGSGVSAAKSAAGHGAFVPPQASGPEVEGLMRQLRQQQERVRAQEEANLAAARQLLAIAEAVRRSQTAPAGGAAGAAPRDADGGASSDASSNLDSASSIDSDTIAAVFAPGAAVGGGLARQYSGAALAREGGGDIAVLDGGRLYSPLLAYASAAMAADDAAGPRRGARRAAAARHALRESPSGLGGAGAAFGAGKPGLWDSASIDLGALAYGGGAFARLAAGAGDDAW